MTTVICFFEVEDGERWANAWIKGTPGNRHEGLFADVATVRTFRDPENHNAAGTLFEIPDMAKFQALIPLVILANLLLRVERSSGRSNYSWLSFLSRLLCSSRASLACEA